MGGSLKYSHVPRASVLLKSAVGCDKAEGDILDEGLSYREQDTMHTRR